tara:strand:- start:358 stop:600 length:243 start_codon:yes stop_codon:yes gene_type:complete
MLDGVKIMFTPEEEIARDIEEAKDLAERPMRKWLGEIADTDAGMPRYAEDILDGIADKSGINQITLDRLQAKKDKRGEKP